MILCNKISYVVQIAVGTSMLPYGTSPPKRGGGARSECWRQLLYVFHIKNMKDPKVDAQATSTSAVRDEPKLHNHRNSEVKLDEENKRRTQ